MPVARPIPRATPAAAKARPGSLVTIAVLAPANALFAAARAAHAPAGTISVPAGAPFVGTAIISVRAEIAPVPTDVTFVRAKIAPVRADGRDGMIETEAQDFFDFIAAFFSNAPDADFNHDGTITSQDFFDFLAAFFTGCP